MKLTPDNVQSVLGVYPEKLFDVLPEVFSKLLEPNQDELVLQNYAVRPRGRHVKISSIQFVFFLFRALLENVLRRMNVQRVRSSSILLGKLLSNPALSKQ